MLGVFALVVAVLFAMASPGFDGSGIGGGSGRRAKDRPRTRNH